MVSVHTSFYRRAASGAKSIGSTLALAPADFILRLGFHRGHSFILPGRARQPVGIVSGFLSGPTRGSHPEHLHPVTARPWNHVGRIGVNLSDRVAFIISF